MHIFSHQSPLALDPLAMTTFGQKVFLAVAHLQMDAVRAMMRYQIEALAFSKLRCEQNVKLLDDLVADGKFSDAFDVFSNFVQNATSQYAIEAGKIASIGSKMTSQAARRVREQAELTLDDMAARTVA